MNRHWIYVAIASGAALFILGLATGLVIPRQKSGMPTSTQETAAKKEPNRVQVAKQVLENQWAKKLFDAARHDASAEISVVRSPSAVRILASHSNLVTNKEPEEFAEAMLQLKLLEAAFLIEGSRKVTRDASETRIYTLTPFGHDVSKAMDGNL